MKTLYKRYIALFGLVLLGFISCDLTPSLDDYTPLYSLPAESAITNESSAELALTGIYSGFRQRSSGSGNPEIYIVPDLLAGFSQISYYYSSNVECIGWISNNPISEGSSIQLGIYTRMYDIINRSNWFLESIAKLSDNDFDTEGRREEMIGEARILRAIGHFYLLRLFGQFYDITSTYGITVKTASSQSAKALPRNTVAEVYETIMADLDAGISQAPDLRGRMYTNKTFAKALKAKVLLYKGDYSSAATLAKEVIDNAGSNFSLATNFANQFQPHTSTALFENPEILFGSCGTPDDNLGIGNFYAGFFASISQVYYNLTSTTIVVGAQSIAVDGGRATSVLTENTTYGGYRTSKVKLSSEDYEMVYHMRFAEVYLILAEASARAATSVTSDALNALNTLRTTRGATTSGGDGFETYPSTISYDQFLTAVRMEKAMELMAETGETWFDLVRFDYVDGFGAGFKVSDVKASATNSDKFILPIPQTTIDAGNGVVIQNPSY
ncbi:MAG: RagB/SusD family nutrient uptake outer membrane protein [Bacteroidales bacterium]